MPRRALTWFLAASLFGLILLVAGCATVQTQDPIAIHRDQNVTVALYEAPCTHPKVVALIPPHLISLFRSGSAIWQGQTFALCWMPVDHGSLVIDETGDSGFIPVAGQKRV